MESKENIAEQFKRLNKDLLVEEIFNLRSENLQLKVEIFEKKKETQVQQIVNINFTDLFYAVLMGATLQNFKPYDIDSKTLCWNWEETILLTSLIIIVDDWVLYHAQAGKIKNNSINFAVLLIFDVLILMTWYLMSKTWYLESHGFKWFLVLLSIFYLLVSLSEWKFNSETKNPVLMKVDLICSFMIGIMAWIFFRLDYLVLYQSNMLFPIIGLVLIRWYAWKELIFKK